MYGICTEPLRVGEARRCAVVGELADHVEVRVRAPLPNLMPEHGNRRRAASLVASPNSPTRRDHAVTSARAPSRSAARVVRRDTASPAPPGRRREPPRAIRVQPPRIGIMPLFVPRRQAAPDNAPPARWSRSTKPAKGGCHKPSAASPSRRSGPPASCRPYRTSSTSRTPAGSRSPAHRRP